MESLRVTVTDGGKRVVSFIGSEKPFKVKVESLRDRTLRKRLFIYSQVKVEVSNWKRFLASGWTRSFKKEYPLADCNFLDITVLDPTPTALDLKRFSLHRHTEVSIVGGKTTPTSIPKDLQSLTIDNNIYSLTRIPRKI